MNEQKKNEYNGHPLFYEILDELKDLHNKKNFQYADSENPLGNFKRASDMVKKLINPKIKNKQLAYALILMSKQIDGTIDILAEDKENTIDGIEGKLKDMAVYSILCIILDREYRSKLPEYGD